jgi:outer membrane lipoprotein-sorting protein
MKRSVFPALLLCAALTFAVALPGPASAQGPLDEVLKKMDQAAANFQTVAADIVYTKVTVIVDDTAVEKGRVFFKRDRGKRDFQVRIDFTEPSEKVVLFRDNKGYIYRPAIKQVEESDVGRNRQALEQFLLLGFGTPGSELLKAYNITLVGDARVAGKDTVKLELLPKSPDMARHIKRVELWLSRETWQPVQQQFTEPNGDYLITLYTGQQFNSNIPDNRFKLNLPRGVKTIRPAAG